MRPLAVAGLLAALTLTATPAGAASLDAFNAEVAGATEGYRSGLFYLRTGNAGLAAIELGMAAGAWQRLEDRFAGAPPAAFADDPAFAPTLMAIGGALDGGAAHADAGDAEAAQETLAPVRDMLFELRRRNGVAVYADCVTELNHQMDRLYVYRHAPPDLSQAEEVAAVKEAGETYGALLARCRAMAPEGHQAAEEFRRLYDGAAASAANLVDAAEAGFERALINVLRELRSFDRMIFLRWG